MNIGKFLAPLLGIAVASGAQASWDEIVAEARGQTVYMNAWGGSDLINRYIGWAAELASERYGIELVHVRLTDTADAVSRVLVEKEAGRDEDGSVDLVWINGENFRAMKANELLFGPFVDQLPSFGLVDTEANPTTVIDFGVPTDGLESPWGMAQFVMIHDASTVPEPPTDLDALVEWAKDNPGRLTYPRPPDFIGTTFLKHVLIDKAGKDIDLAVPPGEDHTRALEAVLDYFDQLHPGLWRGGEAFPSSGPEMHQLYEDGALDFTMAFNPAEAASLVLEGRFPPSTRSYGFVNGSIANTHFVAIPFNATAKEGAMVIAEILLSPEAQARKQDPAHWGDVTVLAMDRLSPDQRAPFEAIELHPAMATVDRLGPALPEPHADWTALVENAWRARYGH